MKTSTFQVNRLTQAKKELKAVKDLPAKAIEALQIEYPERERKRYHVALVTKTLNEAKERFDVSVKMQAYNDRSFPKLKDNLKLMGISSIVLMHDPRNEDFTAKKETFVKRQDDQNAIAEMKAQHEAEMAEMKKKLAEANASNSEAKEEAPSTESTEKVEDGKGAKAKDEAKK